MIGMFNKFSVRTSLRIDFAQTKTYFMYVADRALHFARSAKILGRRVEGGPREVLAPHFLSPGLRVDTPSFYRR